MDTAAIEVPPVPRGRRALASRGANERSIDLRWAKARRGADADIAVTRLNGEARASVRPLAEALDAEICLPHEERRPDRVEQRFEAISVA